MFVFIKKNVWKDDSPFTNYIFKRNDEHVGNINNLIQFLGILMQM